MATAEDYASWIVANEAKRGTPEFDTVVAAYKDLRAAQPAAPAAPPADARPSAPSVAPYDATGAPITATSKPVAATPAPPADWGVGPDASPFARALRPAGDTMRVLSSYVGGDALSALGKKLGVSLNPNVGTFEEEQAKTAAARDRSPGATTLDPAFRAGTNIVAAIPDLTTGVINAGTEAATGWNPNLPGIAESAQRAAGITPTSELPLSQRLIGGTAETFLGNPRNLIGSGVDMLKNAVRAGIDTSLGEAGAAGGNAAVDALGLGDRFRALFQLGGGAAGSAARTAATPAASYAGNKLFGDTSDAKQVPGGPAPAPGLTRGQQVYDDTMAATGGQTPSLGMVADPTVKRWETALENQPLGLGSSIANKRQSIADALALERETMADRIGGGPTAGTDVPTKVDVGRHVVEAANTTAQGLQQAAAGRFENFEGDLRRANAGDMPNVDINPVLAQIQQQIAAAGPQSVEGQFLQTMHDRLAASRGQLPGVQQYAGGIPTHVLPGGPDPMIPWQHAQTMKGELGGQLPNNSRLDNKFEKPIYGAFKDTERAAADALVPGAFDAASEQYRDTTRKGGVVDTLTKIGGGEFGRQTIENGPRLPWDDARAGNLLDQGLVNPSKMGPLLEALAPEHLGPAFADLFRTFGQAGDNNRGFDPAGFAERMNKVRPEGLEAATQTSPAAGPRLREIASASEALGPMDGTGPRRASDWSVLKSLGISGGGLGGGAKLGGMVGGMVGGPVGAAIGPWLGGAVGAGLLPLLSKALESDAVVRGVAGRGTSLADRFARFGGNIPIALQSTVDRDLTR